MKKKIVTIVLLILFIAILILLNIFFKSQNQARADEVQNEVNNEEGEKVEILKVTSLNFDDEVLKSNKTVLIDFYADWCGPCKMLSPIIEEVAKESKNVKFVKINIDDEQNLATKYNIMSIPTLVVMKNGKEVNRSIGLIDKTEIINLIK